MTIDEKLQHFYEVSLEEAREDAAQAIQEHKRLLSEKLEEHRQLSMSVVKSTKLFPPNRSLSKETGPKSRKN